ncbi:MAG: hypothetical protein ACXVCO_14280 [Ktedonobacterales bacterium]
MTRGQEVILPPLCDVLPGTFLIGSDRNQDSDGAEDEQPQHRVALPAYQDAGQVRLVLQDVDILVEANDSTSLLTNRAVLGQKKTRAMAHWAEQRGFQASVVERRFAGNFHIANDEPQLALCGVENPQARAALEEVGFQRIIDAGLGAGPQENLAFQLHTFPTGSRSARDVWKDKNVVTSSEVVTPSVHQPAYQSLLKQEIDKCGVTMLAGRTVGAAFVGATTAAIVIAEALRVAMGAHAYKLVDGSLRSPERRQALVAATHLAPFNPGIVPAASPGTASLASR